MEAMELTAYAQRAPQYLSGGEKKRVTIADVLAMEPEIILLDEPAASLDPAGAAQLEQTLDVQMCIRDRLMAARGTEEVVICYDSDEAGKKAAQRAIDILGRSGLKVRVLRMNGAKDPDEYIRKNGPEDVYKRQNWGPAA